MSFRPLIGNTWALVAGRRPFLCGSMNELDTLAHDPVRRHAEGLHSRPTRPSTPRLGRGCMPSPNFRDGPNHDPPYRRRLPGKVNREEPISVDMPIDSTDLRRHETICRFSLDLGPSRFFNEDIAGGPASLSQEPGTTRPVFGFYFWGGGPPRSHGTNDDASGCRYRALLCLSFPCNAYEERAQGEVIMDVSDPRHDVCWTASTD